MVIEHQVTRLEMTGRSEHRRALEMPGLEARRVADSSAEWGETVRRVGAAHRWPLDNPPTRGPRTFWLIEITGEVVGVAAIEPQHAGNVEIVTFGLVPEVLGRGYGAAALSCVIDLAWRQQPVGVDPIRRIWLHTSSLDHRTRSTTMCGAVYVP